MTELVDLFVEGGANISQAEGSTPSRGRSRHTRAEVLEAIAATPATLRSWLNGRLAEIGEHSHYDVG